MRKTFLLTVICYLICSFSLDAQVYTIKGEVIDEATSKPMEYATVALLKPDSSIVEGTITHSEGRYTLTSESPGNYIVKFGFLGFERIYKPIEIVEGRTTYDIGIIGLHPETNKLNEVVVTGKKSSIEYQIDKKVVHVGDNLATISGSAADVLSNVPSVQVDIEGNISLRGNANFTVLIDDRPTVLDASEALQQIPASSIKDIEIITNPSAKYDPEGTAGIINIITKKRTLLGLSGIFKLDVGLYNRYSGDFLLNYGMKHFNFFLGGELSHRTNPGTMIEEFKSFNNDTTFFRNAIGDRERQGIRRNLSGGIEWFPSEKTTVGVRGDIGFRESNQEAYSNFSTWNTIEGIQSAISTYTSNDNRSRGGNFYSVDADFSQEFSAQDHKLSARINYYYRNGDEIVDNKLLQDEAVKNGQQSSEIGPSFGLRYRLNYKHPINNKVQIETGLQGQVSDSEESNAIYYFNPISREYDFQVQFSNDVAYEKDIFAAYGLILGQVDKFGYQIGFRAERTDRLVNLLNTNTQFTIDRWDYFPTAHFSYALSKQHQFMASYTRRIDRPRGWYLEPFYTWGDAYNVRIGNPNLNPEYINSYEISYQHDQDKYSFSAEVFYNSAINKIESIRSAFSDSVVQRTYINVGTDYALGTELMIGIDAFDAWETNITGRFYQYKVEGRYNNLDFGRQSFTWGIRWNNIVRLGKSVRIQFNPAYESRELEAQEEETGYLRADLAVQYRFLDTNFDITLQFRDVFMSAKYESVINASDFYSYSLYQQKSPQVMLNITYRLNNFKEKKGSGNSNGGNGGDEID